MLPLRKPQKLPPKHKRLLSNTSLSNKQRIRRTCKGAPYPFSVPLSYFCLSSRYPAQTLKNHLYFIAILSDCQSRPRKACLFPTDIRRVRKYAILARPGKSRMTAIPRLCLPKVCQTATSCSCRRKICRAQGTQPYKKTSRFCIAKPSKERKKGRWHQPVFPFSGILFIVLQRATERDAEKKFAFSAEREIFHLRKKRHLG